MASLCSPGREPCLCQGFCLPRSGRNEYSFLMLCPAASQHKHLCLVPDNPQFYSFQLSEPFPAASSSFAGGVGSLPLCPQAPPAAIILQCLPSLPALLQIPVEPGLRATWRLFISLPHFLHSFILMIDTNCMPGPGQNAGDTWRTRQPPSWGAHSLGQRQAIFLNFTTQCEIAGGFLTLEECQGGV